MADPKSQIILLRVFKLELKFRLSMPRMPTGQDISSSLGFYDKRRPQELNSLHFLDPISVVLVLIKRRGGLIVEYLCR